MEWREQEWNWRDQLRAAAVVRAACAKLWKKRWTKAYAFERHVGIKSKALVMGWM